MSFYRHEFEVEGSKPFPLELLSTEACTWNDAEQQAAALATHRPTSQSQLVRIWLAHDDFVRSWTPRDDAWAARSWEITGNKRLIRIDGEEQLYIHKMGGFALEIPRFIATPRQAVERLGGTFSEHGDRFEVRLEPVNLLLQYVAREGRYKLESISEVA